MFTGIISDVGRLLKRDDGVFTIACRYDPRSIDIGASIACDGCCLTVTKLGDVADGGDEACCFTVDVSHETLSRTTLGDWQAGTLINLERALGVGAELGGHIVTGHIDDRIEIIDIAPDSGSLIYRFGVPGHLAGFIAEKGSVAVDGISLTVNGVGKRDFVVNIIPHTQEVTNLKTKTIGAKLNLEVDLLARYVARLAQHGMLGETQTSRG